MPVKWPAGIFGGRNLKADLYGKAKDLRVPKQVPKKNQSWMDNTTWFQDLS